MDVNTAVDFTLPSLESLTHSLAPMDLAIGAITSIRCLGVTVPDVRLIDAVKDEVYQGDGISLVIF